MYEYDFSKKVKIGCDDCRNCSKCCENMGDSIIVDPYDMWMLTSNLRLENGETVSYDILISEDGPLEMRNHDGLILPNIKMVLDERPGHKATENGVCPFLSPQGRCTIHRIRTGLCRLYPLGRNFYPNKLTYFILDENLGCHAKNKSYVSISEWLDIPEPAKYEAFLIKWHYLKKSTLQKLTSGELTQENAGKLMVQFIVTFYQTSYGQDFYEEFNSRAKEFEDQHLQSLKKPL